MLPPPEHPCMGYVCGVPDGTIPGWTIWDCQNAGYYGNLAGCVDPRCVGWRPSIPGCGPQVWRQMESQDPNVPQALPQDSPVIYGGAGKGGCCCGTSGGSTGAIPGAVTGGGGGYPSGDNSAPGSAPCCEDDLSFFGIPWWILLVLVILIVRYRK